MCGASAALAIALVLPPRSDREQGTLFVVIAVTVLSTIAMVAHPVLVQAMGLNDIKSGFLIGATIHDVAQVVGEGYLISDEAGVIATFVKMVRVALLPTKHRIDMMTCHELRAVEQSKGQRRMHPTRPAAAERQVASR
ncbi:MAG: putative sulfate exporter family transporter [Octadecabacter sp.]